jgi:tRNA-intron endonuclease
MEDMAIPGHLLENRIVIWDIADSRKLFSEGFYGKPLGVPKPRGEDFESPLVLDLLEGYFLVRKKRIEVFDAKTRRKIATTNLEKLCESEYSNFKPKFAVYEKLRESGFVVTPGIKFGCDFAVYEHGPGIDHAPYLVRVAPKNEKITAPGVVLSGRLATTVKKQFIVASYDPKSLDDINFVSFDWWKA